MTEHIKVKQGKKVYRIPGLWLVGYCHTGRSPQQAIAHWIEQERLKAIHTKQKLANTNLIPTKLVDIYFNEESS